MQKKTMIMHEIRICKWFYILMVIAILYFTSELDRNVMYIAENGQQLMGSSIYDASNSVTVYGSEFLNECNRLLVMIGRVVPIFIAVFVFSQFIDEKQTNTEEFLSMLPFRNDRRLFYKMSIGMGLFLITGIITFLATFLVQLAYFKIDADSMKSIMLMFFMFLLSTISVYVIFVLFQIIIRNSIISAFVGLAALYTPMFLLTCINNISIRFFDLPLDQFGYFTWRHYTFPWYGDSLGVIQSVWNPETDIMMKVIQFQHVIPDGLVLIVLTAITFLLCIIFNRAKNISEKHQLIPWRSVEICFVIIVGLCFGFLVTRISGSGRYGLFGLIVIMVVVGTTVSIITQELLNKYQR